MIQEYSKANLENIPQKNLKKDTRLAFFKIQLKDAFLNKLAIILEIFKTFTPQSNLNQMTRSKNQ